MNESGFFGGLILSVLSSVIAENIVFARAFGVSPMIAAARNRRSLPGICVGVVYFSMVSSAVLWAVTRKITFAVDKPYLPLLYAGIIGIIYAVTLLLASVLFRKRFSRLKKYVHTAAFNSAVMGTIFLSASSCTELGEFLLFGLCAGLGFAAASDMLSAVYPQLYSDEVPSAFRGYPAVMIYAGITAMAVWGVLGHNTSVM